MLVTDAGHFEVKVLRRLDAFLIAGEAAVSREDVDRENHHENRKALWGFGSRARLKFSGHLSEPSPA